MRKYTLAISALVLTFNATAQRTYDRGRYYEDEDIELLSASDVGYGILAAACCFLVGYGLSKLTKEGSNNLGCVVALLYLGGLFCLIPLFNWLHIILQSVMALGLIVALVGGGIYFLYSLVKK